LTQSFYYSISKQAHFSINNNLNWKTVFYAYFCKYNMSIKITFPDGAVKEFNERITALERA